MSRSTYRAAAPEAGEAPPGRTILDDLIRSFQRSISARALSEATKVTYLATLRRFSAYLIAQGKPTKPEHITREHIEMFLIDRANTPVPRTGQPPKSNSLKLWYVTLQVFFTWLVEMDEIKHSPMARMKPPKVSQESRPVLSADQIRAILKACEGKTFTDRRDYALVMLFVDTGIRVSEMASLQLDDIDWETRSILIRKGKGNKARTVYFGRRTLKALDQYVYLRGGRRDHKDAELTALWLGVRGAMSDAGVYMAIRRRGEKAGVPELHPHLWRHYFIHASMKAGANSGDLMRQTGHSRVEMLLHYGEAAADERARESHRRLGPGDNL